MLRGVLAAYLDRVKEREFDLPFMTLLPRLGFYDIHYTNGQVEFGKDFIAKRVEDRDAIQYSFQCKAGDIGQADWRNKIMGQMLESVLTSLAHPSFDPNMAHLPVLVTTGRLKGNAALGLQDLNKTIEGKYQRRPVVCWERPQLLDHLEKHGLSGIHQATASGLAEYAQFFLIYSQALSGKLSDREIESYSCCWLNESIEADKRILRATVEAEIIATQCAENGFVYEAIHAHLAALRVVLAAIYHSGSVSRGDGLRQVYELGLVRLRSTCRSYLEGFLKHWAASGRDLVRADAAGMVTYLVNCSRVLEIAGCLYFLEDERRERQRLATFITDFVAHEQGAARIVSDHHAVSIVLPVVALLHEGRREEARALIQKSVVWLCDRYATGMGLAGFDADEGTEVSTLLGYPFQLVKAKKGGSFLASVLSDLAAFLGDSQFFSDVVNDMKATSILPVYWQPADTKGQFRIEGEDVLTYPNVQYRDTITNFESYQFADHIKNEPRPFKLAELVGPFSLMIIMLLLRDRYFPTSWPTLLSVGPG